MRDVLLVEDSPTLRHLLREALVRRGFKVTTVDHGADVLKAARQCLPGVVIINKMLPGRDGYAVLGDLRRDPVTSGAKVMMLTEARSREDVGKAIQGGADDYVVKPFDPDDVASRVESLFRVATAPKP